ncbi:hypothetical protein HG530_012679 [Fusarium avenaceum]|nr:hypothetical protein HG530_012679 [Fusarium avenaceum]
MWCAALCCVALCVSPLITLISIQGLIPLVFPFLKLEGILCVVATSFSLTLIFLLVCFDIVIRIFRDFYLILRHGILFDLGVSSLDTGTLGEGACRGYGRIPVCISLDVGSVWHIGVRTVRLLGADLLTV